MYLPRAFRPGWSRCWAWQPEEEDGRRMSWNHSQTSPRNKATAPGRAYAGGISGQTGAWPMSAHEDGWGILSDKCLQHWYPWEEQQVASRAGRKTKQTRHVSLESQIIPVWRTKSSSRNETSLLADSGCSGLVLWNQPLESHLGFICPKPKNNLPESPGITMAKQPQCLSSARGTTHDTSSLFKSSSVNYDERPSKGTAKSKYSNPWVRPPPYTQRGIEHE